MENNNQKKIPQNRRVIKKHSLVRQELWNALVEEKEKKPFDMAAKQNDAFHWKPIPKYFL